MFFYYSFRAHPVLFTFFFSFVFLFCSCISTTSTCRSILVDLILIYCFPPLFPANMCFFCYFVNLKTHHNRNRCA
uniref:Putative secreted peptide n=1 Tax=Anopheles braziliensis TaxID=58242 RepID=A0A2M3ZNM9_9DIPT